MRNSPLSTDTSDHGRKRWWRVGQNAGAQLAARVVAGVCQLALVRLLLAELGVEPFGWTMALVALVGLSQFADLGVAMALQQALSEAWAGGNETALRKTYATGARLLALLGLGWLVVATPLAWWWGERVFTTPSEVTHAGACWLIVAVAMAVGVPLSAGTRLAAALQLGWIAALWTACSSLVIVIVAWLLARSSVHLGAIAYVALLSASQVAPGLICAVQLRARLRWRGRCAPDPGEMRRLWRTAAPFAAQNLAGAALQGATPWMFAHFGGYVANAAFAILQRLLGLAQQGHALLLSPLWPAYAEAQVRGDPAWIARTFRYSVLVTLPVAAAVLVATGVLPWILPLWLGADALLPPAGISWSVAVWIVTAIVGQPLVLLLLGLGRFQRMAPQVTLVHLATLAAMAGLGQRWGGPGVAFGLAAGLTLGVLPIYVRECIIALRSLTRSASTTASPAASV